MSRRHRAQKREVLPDPKFGDLVVTKFMNYVMYEGKKAVAENIVYGAFDILADKKKDQEPVATFHAPWTMSPRRSKSARVASAAPPIRCPSKSARTAAAPWPSAGWSTPRASVARTP